MTSVIVPPVDLAPGMPSRVVTISATDVTEGGRSLEGQMVRFALSDTLDVSSGGDVIAKTQAEVVLDANGEGSIRLPVYDEGVKTWCGQDWAILVTTTWGSQKAIRVPAGTSSIALSALSPVRPLRGREKQWAITGASVTVTSGSTADASVTLSGGVLHFGLTLPDTNPGTLGAARAYTDARTGALHVGKNLWDPATARVGYRMNAVGVPVESSSYTLSGWIPVESGTAYTIWGANTQGDLAGPHSWAFADMKQEVLSYDADTTFSVRTVTAPEDGFLRVTVPHNLIPSPQVEKGTAPTAYEPYSVTIPALDVPLDSESLPDGAITPTKTSFAVEGKNLADPSEFLPGTFINGGAEYPLSGYTTSGWIPVESGAEYVGAVRMWAWYSPGRDYLSSTNSGGNSVNTETAPPSAGWLRASWASSLDPVIQIERGATATSYEPYGVRIPRLLNATGGGEGTAGPVSVSVSGDAVQVGAGISSVTGDLHGSANSAFTLTSASVDGVMVSEGSDEIAPLRTFNTVGANHGYTCIAKLTVPGHGKTAADLGSIWTDGDTEWTLLLVDGDTLTLGPDYAVDGQGVVTAPAAAPAAPLAHVSGATSTGEIPVDQVVAGAQLYPSVQRVYCTLLVDGAVVSEGERHGVTAQVRESYEVLDYASIIDTARANIGTPFHEQRVKGAVRVENVYTFKPGLILVDAALTELEPTTLGSCGFVQAIRPTGPGGRIVPGVTGWTTPRPFADTWSSEVITASDLIDPAIPPTMSLDVMDWGGFALGYMPWQAGATSSAERIEHGANRLWDLRSTQKSYPSPWSAKAAGWGRVEAHAYRAYLTPAQADAVAVVAEDAHAAHSALATVTGL